MNDLKEQINQVEHIAKRSRFGRLLHDPIKYVIAICFQKFIYPITKRGWKITTKLFYGENMKIILPAATDIYLTGGKSHDSEIRLAKFMISNLSPNDTFLDIGAHFGYFSLLASEIVGIHGKVYSFEASKSTFSILKNNTSKFSNITIYNNAVSDTNEQLTFYEFPIIYSEYNAIDYKQYQKESWFKKANVHSYSIDCVTLDDIIVKNHLHPGMIKIDVEGAECNVLKGANNFLSTSACIVIIEYLSGDRVNTEHRKAKEFLEELGYTCNVIDQSGRLIRTDDIEGYLIKNSIYSDNIVFIKSSE